MKQLSLVGHRTPVLPGVQRKLLAPALDLLARVKVYMEEEVLAALVQDTFRAFPRLQVGGNGHLCLQAQLRCRAPLQPAQWGSQMICF